MTSLAIGTVQFGMPYGIGNARGKIDLIEAREILELAKKNNINTIDTAIAYGDSEKNLGILGVRDFKLITKLPALPFDCVDVDGWVFNQVRLSFSRINANSIYGLLLHHPKDLLSIHGMPLYRALLSLKDRGIVQKIGISIYNPDDLDLLVSDFQLDLVQAPLNLVDRRLIRSNWLYRLKDYGYEVHVRSVFLQGLLLMNQDDRPSRFTRWNNIWDKWHAWNRDQEAKPIETCLSYAFSFPEIDKVVVGVDGLNQFKEIIDVINLDKKSIFPNISSDDELLINPSKWDAI
jgi:aryl-alcohol dehydrogenase-like predicted oxidoreductase